ncbi:zinc finger protein 836-like [Phlebotomus argentipes]|uniref:zinc finger protein 836-like n=1 Tax=Phlebotomus argentipes TaxID=94469 RepID=UPI00289308DC|nr:zinc finger protein 836-like [Phlebotomus argentipes]
MTTADIKVSYKMESTRDQLEIINKYFMISKYSDLLSGDNTQNVLTDPDPLEPEVGITTIFKEEWNEEESIATEKRKVKTQERLNRGADDKGSDNICAICSRRYVFKHWLEVHIRKKHLIRTEKEKEKKYACSKCPKHFVNKTRLKFHEITHVPKIERCIIPCPQCDKKLSSQNGLRIHLKNIHSGEKPFICEECGKAFVSAGALKEHKISHSEERSFQCSVCMKRFKNQPQLNRHEERHKDNVYECPHCDVKRNTKASIKLHMVIHSDFKKYKCNYCGIEFKRLKSLKDHLIIHAGLRPYECQFCERTFANASNCLKHKKNSHPVELAAFKASGTATKASVVLPKLEHLQPKIAGQSQILPSERLK